MIAHTSRARCLIRLCLIPEPCIYEMFDRYPETCSHTAKSQTGALSHRLAIALYNRWRLMHFPPRQLSTVFDRIQRLSHSELNSASSCCRWPASVTHLCQMDPGWGAAASVSFRISPFGFSAFQSGALEAGLNAALHAGGLKGLICRSVGVRNTESSASETQHQSGWKKRSSLQILDKSQDCCNDHCVIWLFFLHINA